MKKLYAILCAVFIMLVAFGLTACGRDEAKVTGVYSSVTASGADNYSDALANTATVAENDYIVKVGEAYDLTVELTAYGGSKYPVLDLDGATVYYDTDIFDITPPSNERPEQVLRYKLIAKRAVDYAAILVVADNRYSYTVIVSAEL